MSTTCKYCNDPENKQYRPGLICENCISFVHLSCLRRQGTPGDLSCDVFFTYTCEDCSPEMKEIFARSRFPWVNVILLTLYHLNAQSYGISNHGFFHYKTHICSFIDRYWNVLFEPQFKQKKNWIGTIAGALSLYNNLFFRSGSVMLGETGWWKLMHAFSPAVASHILQEMTRDRPKSVPRSQMFLDKGYFIRKVTEMGYNELISDEKDYVPLTSIEPAMKKRRMNSDEMSMTSSVNYDPFDSDSRNDGTEEVYNDPVMLMKEGSVSDAESNFRGFEYAPVHYVPPSDSSSTHSQRQTTFYYDSDSGTATPTQTYNQSDSEEKIPDITKKIEKQAERIKPVVRETLFSSQLNSVNMPWVEKTPEPQSDLVEMSQYEEIQLLKQVEGLIPKIKDVNKKAYLCRFKAKLALRRLKRHKHLPLFDLDKSAKLLSGCVTEDTKEVIQVERVLDRFQRSYLMDNLTGTIASTNYGTLLLSTVEPAPFRSTYSSTILKPFIRRDFQTKPMWLKLTDELLIKTNKHVEEYSPPPTASVDYSYVRPHHIAALNSLCAQFFWPGIDLTESLQYPEFSCVVSYKKLVIGFAFLVPDVQPNEAYISFIFTRPEWRNSRIATFMLYHLLQTCTGKDVTLHVSPTNPAVFLYQKFGFKVEELIQDFYEKYYDIDYKGCRHALFLRLVR